MIRCIRVQTQSEHALPPPLGVRAAWCLGRGIIMRVIVVMAVLLAHTLESGTPISIWLLFSPIYASMLLHLLLCHGLPDFLLFAQLSQREPAQQMSAYERWLQMPLARFDHSYPSWSNCFRHSSSCRRACDEPSRCDELTSCASWPSSGAACHVDAYVRWPSP